MKKTGIMNSELSRIVASMGHTDFIIVCDSGYPIPKGVERIDLSLTQNMPTVIMTIQEISKELQVERIQYALEAEQYCPEIIQKVLELFPTAQSFTTSHEQFKEMAKSAAAIIRTGECTPYSNVILCAGVIF
ncbi:MAG TPA: D-ribose pyranase [Paenibacillus sp.]|jgi:D-ribose pyranase